MPIAMNNGWKFEDEIYGWKLEDEIPGWKFEDEISGWKLEDEISGWKPEDENLAKQLPQDRVYMIYKFF